MQRSLLALSLLAAPLVGQTLTTETVVTGLSRPVWVGSPPGNDDRIFVCEQNSGLIRIVENGAILPTPFLDVDALTVDGGERGLLGMEFHPKFQQNGIFFINYTDATGGDTVVARYEVSAGDPNVADPSSATILFEVDSPFTNHNAGDLAFSPVDGYLYIPLGDGGSGNDPGCRAQNPQVMQGKCLRIDVDNPSGGNNYGIPADNPFVGDPNVLDEIWSLGWRNPFRMSFDPLTGDMYVGDVGQGLREEVSFEPALAGGRNYGWPVMEGDQCKQNNFNNCAGLGITTPACFDAAYTDPVFTYSIGTQGRAIIGGVVYRGCAIPDMQGTYFVGDNNSGRFWSFEMVGGVATNVQQRTTELSGAGSRPSDFGYDNNGEILIANLTTGVLSRIVAVTPPSITDCDGNGKDDACEIATIPWADTDGSGVLDACESFSVDTDSICVSVGGRQEWSLHAGAAQGGNGYLMLGSFAGTSPGLPFGAVVLPLNPDFYFVLAAQLANNNSPFEASFGVLDGAGNASAAFNAPAGLLPPSVVGLTANHAYVAFDGSLAVVFASNSTSLDFLP